MNKRIKTFLSRSYRVGTKTGKFLFLSMIFCLAIQAESFQKSNETETKDRFYKSEKIKQVGDSRVRWRFRMDGLYSFVRPAIASDGTIYVVDSSANLYALTPGGNLLWRFQGAGDKGVAVGADGTIYTASESNIKAINRDGTLKWQFDLNPRAFVTLGVAVGPDGNIYSVAYESLGVFSLTPQGTLRWSTPEPYRRPIVEYGEIVFGRNGKQDQLYFYANGRIRAVRLSDGATVFPLGTISQPFGQPDVSPLDNTVHANVLAYTPNGDLLWLLFNIYPGSVGFPAVDVGADGVHYVVYPGQRLYALNPNGSIKYQKDFSEVFGDPVASPDNSTLVIGTAQQSNSIAGFDPANGNERWRVTLPLENGLYQSITTRAKFSADGQTAYLHTATFDGQNGTSFLYAIDASMSGENAAPHAAAGADRTAGRAPITIRFNSNGSFDPDGQIVSYFWEFGDGSTSTEANPAHVYNSPGRYNAHLVVTDNFGATGETFLPLEFTAGGCVTNCARVSSIDLTAFRQPGNIKYVGTIHVQNENGQPLANATVKIGWVVPNRPVFLQTVVTNGSGDAQASIVGENGTYTLGVSLVVADGYTFDDGNSILSATITR